MASLTRKDRSPYWFACFTNSHGIRTKISTKQTDRRKAMKVAVEWETLAQRASSGRLTEAQARKVISEMVEHVAGEPIRFYTVTSAALNAARRQGYIPQNPAEAIEPLKHTAESKCPFTSEQVGALLAVAPGDWRGAILFAYFTGARLQDVANMRWDAIDLAKKTIRFVPQKTRQTGKEVVIPIHSQLEESLLATAGSDNPHAFLFPTLAGKKTGGAHGLSSTFASIMAKAGITTGEARPRSGQGRAVSRLSFHSLRHSFNSAMANRGVSQELRMQLTGHATADMNKVYTQHEMKPLRAAVELIPAIKVSKA